MMKSLFKTMKWVLAVGLLIVGRGAFAAECSVEGLQGLKVAGVTIRSAKFVPASEHKQARCEVRGALRTDGEGAGPGSAGFTMVLPAKWNGKFMFGGGRGTGGMLTSSANEPDIDVALEKGYASATTDSGHLQSDDNWYAGPAPGKPNVAGITDYFYRATHQVTLAAKALVSRNYGGVITRSYFNGCSNGGRQAIMEAIRYPQDFDGIIAGCPWVDFAGSALLNVQRSRSFLDPAHHIPLSKFAQIDAAVVASCDIRDGVRDGMIQNPMNCNFDPHSLVPSLLTKAQADGLDTYLSAVRDEKGSVIAPGSSVSRLQMQFNGVRNGPDGTPLRAVVYEEPAPYPTASYPWGKTHNESHSYSSARAVVAEVAFNDIGFDLTNGLYRNDGTARSEQVRALYDRLGAGIVADPARLDPFLKRGGKILMYHGLSDMTISGYGPILYYRELARLHGGFRNIQDAVRFFLVPGMQHCNDGPEPVFFNTLDALERWVEQDIAPDTMLAHYTENAGKTVTRTMPLCKFPAQAMYRGTGDVKEAANWSCPPEDSSMLKVARNGKQAGMDTDLAKFHAKYTGLPKAEMSK